MDYFPRKLLSKYLIKDTIDFNKHMHDNDIFINDKWRKYARGDIGRLFKITRRFELRFWPMTKRNQPSQGDFFTRSALQREPCTVSSAVWCCKNKLQPCACWCRSKLRTKYPPLPFDHNCWKARCGIHHWFECLASLY
jgi:hypothetical protein